jgi:cytochrome P450
MTFSLLSIQSGCLCIGSYFLVRWLAGRKTRAHNLSLPPGPRGLPVVGALFQWPTKDPWIVFSQWAAQHGTTLCFITFYPKANPSALGKVVYTSILGSSIILLNTPEACAETFGTRGAIYSDRPLAYFADVMVGWNRSVPRMKDGPLFRELRRIINEEIGSKAKLKRFEPLVDVATRRLMSKLLSKPRCTKLSSYVRQ